MEKDIKLLTNLISSIAISGYEWEQDLPNKIQKIAKFKGEKIQDNLIFKFGQGEKKIFISAHMDEVGFMITKIKNNYILVVPIGEILVKDCIGKRLIFNINGKEQTSKRIKPVKSFSEMKIYGLKNSEIGNIGTFEKKVSTKGTMIKSPSLDNKVGCLVLLKVINKIKIINLNKTIIFCFAAKEEISTNSLVSIVNKFKPNFCIDIDSAYAKPIDSPKNKINWSIPTLGKGPAIQLLGKGFVITSNNKKLAESVAKKYSIPFQYEIPDGQNGSTNAKGLINAGYNTLQINVPVANQHSSCSKASIVDIVNTAKLISNLISKI